MKTKIGTVLQTDLVRRLKKRAAEQRRPMSALIDEALQHYFLADAAQKNERLSAARKLCSAPFDLELREIRDILNEDYYNQ